MLRKYLLLLPLSLSMITGSATAGSIRCQGEILRDDQDKPPLEEAVRKLCGKPVAEDFHTLIYRTDDNVTKVLRFNDAGELESVTETPRQ